MRTLKILFMMGVLASPAMGQDYYSPTDKEKEPVARFPLDNIVVRDDGGQKVIEYTLPLELTGLENKISAREVQLPNLGVKSDVRVYAEDRATITCMGEEVKPGCVVVHRKLAVDKGMALAAINEKYFDPKLRADATTVMTDFQENAPLEHSGNQPIGILGNLNVRSPQTLASKTMHTQFYRNGTWTPVEIKWGERPISMTYLNGSGLTGTLTQVKFIGNRARGKWNVDNGPSGWFDFEFNAAKTEFSGFYGDGNPGSPRVNRWIGR